MATLAAVLEACNSQRMRDAMMRAAAMIGDENGKGGYVGWLRRIALAYPLEFFQEASKLEPKVVAASVDESFNVSIMYTSSDEARAALEEAGIAHAQVAPVLLARRTASNVPALTGRETLSFSKR